ncbi:tetratricopeptide repeat protein [Streptomyces sp. NPDC046900]|uniref:tetratricopeptide repeat protein n=1 Tax=Streptomyces sp. NPDC046900 TaxID=3155473 RepID=UPI0033E0D027
MRWGLSGVLLSATFFGSWGLCALLFPGLGQDVALALAGLATAVVSLPLGVWAGNQRPSVRDASRRFNRGRLDPDGRGQVVVGEIPREPPAYQQRLDLRQQLVDIRGIAVVTAVTGSRGIGKTHLAAGFARHCIAQGWPLVAWIVAEDENQAMAGMDRLARALGLTARQDDSLTAARKARAWLEVDAGARSLLVFDNVPDPEPVRRWLPAAGAAHVIVTSTSHACEDLGTPVRVEAFSLSESVAFLHQRTGLDEDADAQALAEEVGCLPLALGQAAAAIRTQRLSCRTLLERIKSMPMDRLLLTSPGDHYPDGAAQAVLLALRTVEDADPLARTLTGVVMVLSAAGTFRTILHAYAEHEGNSGGVTCADIDATIGRMVEASLLTFTLDGEAVLMHRFTQRVLRDRARRTGTLDEPTLLAAQLVAACRPTRADMWDRRAVVKHLILQTDALWAPAVPESATPTTREILGLRIWGDHALWTIGDALLVLERAPQVIADCRRLLGDDCEDTNQARYGLALAYGALGRHDEATEMNQNIVDWYTAHRGPDHPMTLNHRNTLGNNYLESGRDFGDPARLQAAIALHEETYARYKRAPRPDDALALRSAVNLARAYREGGRIREAVSLAEQLLHDSERAVRRGEESALRLGRPTLWARAVLAQAYAADENVVAAMPLIEQTISESSTEYGAHHPYTWDYRLQRAAILQQAGRPSIAITEIQNAVAYFAEIQGEYNASTRQALVQLADTCREEGRLPEALEAYERALASCTHTLGTDNPITLHVAGHLTELRNRHGSRPTRRVRRLLGHRGSA